MKLLPLPINKLPKPLPLKKLIGPSFILLGLGLGSGELILWPYLTSHYGMGIIWGALIGITFQFFMNMEIERYALVKGESIFVGFARKLKILPFWFILSTFIPWIWPGIIASSATLIGNLFGFENTKLVTIILLIIIGLILSLGPVLYKTQEFVQKVILLAGVPTIFVLALLLAKGSDWTALAQGLIGKGDGFWFLPSGLAIATFLGALAYSGAGGNLNLAQSSYVREKGYGMGAYAEKIRSLLLGNKKEIKVTGTAFEINNENMSNFKKWWKNINIEHLFVFWAMGAVTMILLGLLSFSTIHGHPEATEGIGFLFLEAREIGKLLFPFAGTLFLAISAVTLISTQLGVFDATSRIISENIILASTIKENKISKVYYTVLWLQILAGIVILLCGVTQPLQLVVISAVLNAFAMFVHVGLTLWTNLTLLEKELKPKFIRALIMVFAFLFYGGFSVYIIIDKFI